jgi:5-methylcytosine-specific restriction endonuclease McrA
MPYADPDRRRAYGREWMRLNADKARDAMRRWRAANRDVDRAAKRAYYAANDEAVRAANKAYAQSHPEVAVVKRHRRRERVSGQPGFTAQEWRALLEAHQHRCAYCFESARLQVEHKVPIARGGKNTIDNIVPACARCNTRKHLLTDEEFCARLAAENHE